MSNPTTTAADSAPADESDREGRIAEFIAYLERTGQMGLWQEWRDPGQEAKQ